MRSSVIISFTLAAFALAAPVVKRDDSNTAATTQETGGDGLTNLMVAAKNFNPDDPNSTAAMQAAAESLTPEEQDQLRTVGENASNAFAVLASLNDEDRAVAEKYIIKHLTPAQVAALLVMLEQQNPQTAATNADPSTAAGKNGLPKGTVKKFMSLPDDQRQAVLSYVLATDMSEDQFTKLQELATKLKADDDQPAAQPKPKPQAKVMYAAKGTDQSQPQPQTKQSPQPKPASGPSDSNEPSPQPQPQPQQDTGATAGDQSVDVTDEQAGQIGAYLQCIDATQANQLVSEAEKEGVSQSDLDGLKASIPSLNDPNWVADPACAAAGATSKRSLADLD